MIFEALANGVEISRCTHYVVAQQSIAGAVLFAAWRRWPAHPMDLGKYRTAEDAKAACRDDALILSGEKSA